MARNFKTFSGISRRKEQVLPHRSCSLYLWVKSVSPKRAWDLLSLPGTLQDAQNNTSLFRFHSVHLLYLCSTDITGISRETWTLNIQEREIAQEVSIYLVSKYLRIYLVSTLQGCMFSNISVIGAEFKSNMR